MRLVNRGLLHGLVWVAISAVSPMVRGHHIYAPPDRNVTLLGQRDQYVQYSDIWGYTTPTGDEWALIGTLNGVSIVDTTNPASMSEVAFISGPSSQWRDIKTWDHYAYIVTEGADSGTGLQIVDLALVPPQLVNTVDTDFTTSHNLHIDEAGYAYIVGTSAGMHVLSLADPVNPVEVAFYDAQYVHDIYVRDGIVYASEFYRGGMEVLDFSLESGLTPVGFIAYPGAAPHNVWLPSKSL